MVSCRFINFCLCFEILVILYVLISIFSKTAFYRVGFARKDVNDKDNSIRYLAPYALVFHKEYPNARKIDKPSNFRHCGQQRNLSINHLEQILAIFITTVAYVKVA